MAGRPKEDPAKTQQQEIAEKKDDFIAFYKELPIKTAAANWIGRSLDTINNWEELDPEFADRVLRAKADYARKHGKSRPDHLLPKLYPEFKPEKQEISANVTGETKVTIIYGTPDEPVSPFDHQDQPDVEAAPDVAQAA